MENQPPLPPKLKITGVWRDDPDVTAALSRSFEAQKVLWVPNEVPHSAERQKQLVGLGQAFLELGKDLGLDLRERIPRPSDYHFFKTKADFDTAMRSMAVKTHETLRGMTLPHDIFILDQDDEFYTLCMAAHETVHFMAQKKKGTGGTFAEDGGKRVKVKGIRLGYRYADDDSKFEGLDELATDLTYLHVLRGGYWDKQPDLPKADERHPTHYSAVDVIGEELILTAAEKTGVDPLSILQAIEIDILTGKVEGLRMITEILPPPLARELIHAPHHIEAPTVAEQIEEFRRLAQKLNLSRAAMRIEELKNAKSADVLRWVDTKKRMAQTAIKDASE